VKCLCGYTQTRVRRQESANQEFESRCALTRSEWRTALLATTIHCTDDWNPSLMTDV
jgi:hypothetical protein